VSHLIIKDRHTILTPSHITGVVVDLPKTREPHLLSECFRYGFPCRDEGFHGASGWFRFRSSSSLGCLRLCLCLGCVFVFGCLRLFSLMFTIPERRVTRLVRFVRPASLPDPPSILPMPNLMHVRSAPPLPAPLSDPPSILPVPTLIRSAPPLSAPSPDHVPARIYLPTFLSCDRS